MNEYFLQQHSTAIYTSILYELILEELINVIQVYFSESEYSTNGSSSGSSNSSSIVHDITILLQQAKLKTGLNYDTIPHTATSSTNTNNTSSNNTTIILNKLTRRATIYRENTTTTLKSPTRNTEISISPRFSHS